MVLSKSAESLRTLEKNFTIFDLDLARQRNPQIVNSFYSKMQIIQNHTIRDSFACCGCGNPKLLVELAIVPNKECVLVMCFSEDKTVNVIGFSRRFYKVGDDVVSGHFVSDCRYILAHAFRLRTKNSNFFLRVRILYGKALIF